MDANIENVHSVTVKGENIEGDRIQKENNVENPSENTTLKQEKDMVESVEENGDYVIKEEEIQVENNEKDKTKQKQDILDIIDNNNDCVTIKKENIEGEKIIENNVENLEIDISAKHKQVDMDSAIKEELLSDLIDTAVNNIEENNLNTSNNTELVANSIITKEMIAEEKRLEREQEQEMQQQLAEIEKQIEEEKCFKRLHLLLSRSNVFSRFMADKLANQDNKNKSKKSKKNHADNDKQNPNKRKADPSLSPTKKRKCAVNVMDVYKKENMSSLTFETIPDNKAAEDKSDEDKHPSLFYGGKMRSYQIEGYEWLKTLYENGVNGILADEMGLGKTIQSIAVIAYLIEMGVPGPFFVCGPLSTLPNWYSEFQRFTPDIPVILYHGSKEERPMLCKKIKKKVKNDRCSCYPVVITSYQVALMDVRVLSRIEWKMLVLDEAHRVKNFNCQLIQALRKYDSSHRLLLTGTPLQNNLDELWSLLNFILPEIFDDLLVFQSWFNMQKLTEGDASKEILAKEQEKQIVSTIHEILTPFLLRRTKADVELNLPPKKEVVVHAFLSSLQQKYYVAILNRSIAKLFHKDSFDPEEITHKRIIKKTDIFGVDSNGDIMPGSNMAPPPKTYDPEINFEEFMGTLNLQMRNTSMLLRQVCNHPYMLYNPNHPVDESYIKASGKLRLLDVMLAELKKRGHKVLIFSQFLGVLDILEDYCYYRNYQCCRLDGGMNLDQRKMEMEDFKEENSFIFLISTRAGGLGINLATADTVIIYDSDWNPQADLQAQDRCHRIGQTKPVVVYRYIIPNTVDERIFKFANAKRKLEKAILRNGRFKSKTDKEVLKPMTKEELVELLKSVEDINLVKADDENILSPEELEKILDRSDMT